MGIKYENMRAEYNYSAFMIRKGMVCLRPDGRSGNLVRGGDGPVDVDGDARVA
jgi:hypothetical protein